MRSVRCQVGNNPFSAPFIPPAVAYSGVSFCTPHGASFPHRRTRASANHGFGHVVDHYITDLNRIRRHYAYSLLAIQFDLEQFEVSSEVHARSCVMH